MRRILTIVLVAFFAVWLTVASTDPAIGWVIPIALGGGVTIAALLVALQSRTRRSSFTPDSFGRGGVDSVIDIAHIRVAGIGGLGLVVAAGVVALQFQLISAAVAAGAIGGGVAGVLLILYRRGHDGARSAA